LFPILTEAVNKVWGSKLDPVKMTYKELGAINDLIYSLTFHKYPQFLPKVEEATLKLLTKARKFFIYFLKWGNRDLVNIGASTIFKQFEFFMQKKI
jgi:hypothetical protein